MPDDRRRPPADDLALNRFWNELVRPTGDPDAAAADLDPDLAETVRRLRALARTPPPVSARARVRRGLTDQSSPPRNGKETTMLLSGPLTLPGSRLGPNGRVLPPTARARPGRSAVRWLSVQFATALLLLVTLFFGYLAYRDHRPAAILPPLAAPATPGPGGVTEELLAVVDLPAGALPGGDRATWNLGRVDVPPGARAAWPAANGACCPGPRIEHVLAGTYVVRAAGPVRVLRAGGGGAAEAVPAGTEVVLGPGDTLVSRNETAFEAANPGAAPVDLLVAVFAPVSLNTDPIPPGWITRGVDTRSEPVAPAEPVTLRLRLVTLAPGAVLPAPRQGGVQLVVNPMGAPVVGVVDGKAQNVGDEPATVPVLTYEPPAPGAGTPAAGTPAA